MEAATLARTSLPVDDGSLWAELNLDAEALSIDPTPAIRSSRAPTTGAAAAAAAWRGAVDACVEASVTRAGSAREALRDERAAHTALSSAHASLLATAARLGEAEDRVRALQQASTRAATIVHHGRVAHEHLSAFVHELALPPALVRHVVDGRVGDAKYAQCLTELRKKRAVYAMADVRAAAAHAQLRPFLDKLVAVAVRKTRALLLRNIALLRRPNTNLAIVKQTVLLPHRACLEFLEDASPSIFTELRQSYVTTMARTYFTLFRKYANGLSALRVEPAGDALVGGDAAASSAAFSRQRSLVVLFSRDAAPRGAAATPAPRAGSDGGRAPDFSLDARLRVLREVGGAAVVLATARDSGLRVAYEEMHRSIGKMLCETCTSEHLFCANFFGESDGRMFEVFFKPVVDTLLDHVAAYAASTRDAIGVLLSLKINEAQRAGMQQRRIMDLSDFFIQVDILLKPRFKRLLDENVASLTAATQAVAKGDAFHPRVHPVTQRYVQLSAAVLAIGAFGAGDDGVADALRRLRAEFGAFMNAASARFSRSKERYMFLVNNVDAILAAYRAHALTHTEEYRSYAELQAVHTAAYVEHEVADHFPDLVTFVREQERVKGGTEEKKVRAVLREFAANWRYSVQHMQESVQRELSTLAAGADISRALFARLLAYHKRCERAIDASYSALRNDLVTSTEIVYELRQKAAGGGANS